MYHKHSDFLSLDRSLSRYNPTLALQSQSHLLVPLDTAPFKGIRWSGVSIPMSVDCHTAMTPVCRRGIKEGSLGTLQALSTNVILCDASAGQPANTLFHIVNKSPTPVVISDINSCRSGFPSAGSNKNSGVSSLPQTLPLQ